MVKELGRFDASIPSGRVIKWWSGEVVRFVAVHFSLSTPTQTNTTGDTSHTHNSFFWYIISKFSLELASPEIHMPHDQITPLQNRRSKSDKPLPSLPNFVLESLNPWMREI